LPGSFWGRDWDSPFAGKWQKSKEGNNDMVGWIPPGCGLRNLILPLSC